MSTTATYDEIREAAQARLDKNMKIKTLIIDRLGLEVSPEVVSDNQPLFGRGLEMDSLDSLEIVVMVNNEFGVSVNDDDIEAFGSINALVDFVEAHED
ncbi:phosphopantetheine-binding protein [Labedaea rhizosphaerae]|uniref:Acyl carrier protein n=1 Tax=Labedaea rhizosphaerae TaxID=598644 RepID=A0A4R6S986_LABRH|nr:phosphopantetheine-binding protein [Labedaea rhizosphaerae]TDP96482.1 acyl carrier protein [Labedaea rhizosphaerae]